MKNAWGWFVALTIVEAGCGGTETATPATQRTTATPSNEVPASEGSAPEAPPAPSLPSSGPGFVVYTIEPGFPTRRSTVVVPFDPSIPVRRMNGIVVLDDAPAPPALQWLTFTEDDPCACGCADDERGSEQGSIFGIDPSTFELDADSACVPDDCAHEDEEEDEDEECESASETFATMVGGRVFAPLDTHIDCEGYNLYGNELRTFSITRAEWSVPAFPSRGVTCEGAHSTAGWPSVRHERAPLDCTLGRAGFRARNRAVDCGRCDGAQPGIVVARVTRGSLQTLDVMVTGDGTGTAWLAEVPLRATNCPSSADPCGDPAAFAALRAAPDEADFWVATDGAVAMLLAKNGEGRWKLATFAAGAGEAIRTFDAGFDPTGVFGVRMHADVGLLARLADHGLPGRRLVTCRAARDDLGN